MSDKELQEIMRRLANAQIETEKQLAKTDAQLAKTDAQLGKTDERLNRIAKMVGAMGNNQGDVTEEYFINSLKDTLEVAGRKFDVLIPNFTIQAKDIIDEYDILLVNGKELAIIEVKYKIHTKDIDKLKKKIKNIKSLPQYKNYRVYAGVAGFKVPKDVISLAKDKGYFVLQRRGDIIETMADNLKVS